MKSLDYRYADVALQWIQVIEQKEAALKELFSSICRQFPAMVRLNGLRLTVTFFEVKGEVKGNPEKDQLTARAYELYLAGIGQALEKSDWTKHIPENCADYRRMTEQVLRASMWFKRYAEVIIRTDAKDERSQTV